MSESCHILVVDDDPVQRLNLRLALEDLGHTVCEAADGRAGLALYAQARPDLVVTDLVMPHLDGIALLKELQRRDRHLPVIVLSGSGELRDAVAAVRAGAWDYLPRPLDSREELELTIRRARERARLMVENDSYRLHLEELVAQRTNELRDSESRFRALFASANDAILLLREGRIITVNPKASELFACGYNELTDRTLMTFSPLRQPDGSYSGQRLKDYYDEALAGTPLCFEWQILRHDDRPLAVEISLNRLVLRQAPHLQAVIRDISERKRLADRLGHTQRLEAIGRLAAGVAHDFNNMLTAISGYAQLADWRFGCENGELHNCLNEIQLAAARAAHMTEGLLAFSRKRTTAPTLCDLGRIVDNMEKMLRRLIGEETVLATHLSAEPLPILADIGQIDQILLNLVTNANDAIDSRGRIDIATAAVSLDRKGAAEFPGGLPGDYACLTVSDSGCGITEEIQRHIFEPFYTTKEGQGSGLGLAIVYGVVQQHKGLIALESSPGRGTTFRVLIPLQRGEVVSAALSGREEPPATPGQGTILIAEDSPTVLAIMRDTLEAAGYRVIPAEDGEQALAIVAEQLDRIDLALLDVIMPKLGGLALARELRRRRPELKLIFVSGNPAALNQIADLEHETVMSKPVTPFRLLQQVRLSLEER